MALLHYFIVVFSLVITCGISSAAAAQNPSAKPSTKPSYYPTLRPTTRPTRSPSRLPTLRPSIAPTKEPSASPTDYPTPTPTEVPTVNPSGFPSSRPTGQPHPHPRHNSQQSTIFIEENALLAFFCVLIAGLASGLTQGMLSLNTVDLKIKAATGSETEKRSANALLALREHHHLLLVTLLLLNATAMELLPMALDKIISKVGAIIISVTLVLLMGEIIPASIMTGPYQLVIVTFLIPFVWCFMILFYPLAYPISKVLDYALGHDEESAYSRIELRTMVQIQCDAVQRKRQQQQLQLQQRQTSSTRTIVNSSTIISPIFDNTTSDYNKGKRGSTRLYAPIGSAEPAEAATASLAMMQIGDSGDIESNVRTSTRGGNSSIGVIKRFDSSKYNGNSNIEETFSPMQMQSTTEEISMIDSVLRFRDLFVRDVMSTQVFMLHMDDVLDIETINKIFKSGYSRIPIYGSDRNDIMGLIIAKDLICLGSCPNVSVKSFMSLFCRHIICVWSDDKLAETLKEFRKTKSYIAIVRDVNNTADTDPFYEVKGVITLEDIVGSFLGMEVPDETDAIDEHNNIIKDEQRNIGISRRRLIRPSLIQEADSLSDLEVFSIAVHIYATVPKIDTVLGSYDEAIPKLKRLVSCATLAEVSNTNNSHTSSMSWNQQQQQQQLPFTSLLASLRRDAKGIGRMTGDEDDDNSNSINVLYRKDRRSNLCIFILSGSVNVLSGRDQFRVTIGPWSLLGQECLLNLNSSQTQANTNLSSDSNSNSNSISNDSSKIRMSNTDGVTFIPDFTAIVASTTLKYLILQPSILLDAVVSDNTSTLSQPIGNHNEAANSYKSEYFLTTESRRRYDLTRKLTESNLIRRKMQKSKQSDQSNLNTNEENTAIPASRAALVPLETVVTTNDTIASTSRSSGTSAAASTASAPFTSVIDILETSTPMPVAFD